MHLRHQLRHHSFRKDSSWYLTQKAVTPLVFIVSPKSKKEKMHKNLRYGKFLKKVPYKYGK
jgi:hypothetical protein